MTRDISPLQKLRQSGISPDKALGQNFLVDPNILSVIERMAGLGGDDCVLEVGPGLGVLTERLLRRCRLVHCMEVDERLAAHVREEFTGAGNLRLHVVDAMKADLAGLEPPPDKFVSNLPYNIAAPLVMRSLEELPSIRLWCLMLQKEMADRLFAETGAANYGGISVMTRLSCEKLSSHPVSGNVFYPRPRVKSSLLAFRRRDQGPAAETFPRVKAVVYGAFSHRRKTLVNSLADADMDNMPSPLATLTSSGRKRRVAAALNELGLPASIRAQDLEPVSYPELTALLGGSS